MSGLIARAVAVAATSAVRRAPGHPRHVHLVRCRSHGYATAAAAGASPQGASAPGLQQGGGGGGPPGVPGGALVSARRGPAVPRAIPKKAASTYDSVRLRASDEFKGGDDDDEDPLMHMGRPNRTALKRLMLEYKELTKVLCELPKSSLNKIPMPDHIRDEVYATVKISSNIARKRSEGLITKYLRGLDDDEVLPIQRAVENLQSGVGLLSVTPEVEEAATRWRELLMAGDKETQNAVFELMQQSDSWKFTRQELGQLVTSATREKGEADAVRAGAAAAKEALEAAATVMADGTMVPSAKGGTTGKRKKAGAGKSTKTLLKHLRSIAEVASGKGLL